MRHKYRYALHTCISLALGKYLSEEILKRRKQIWQVFLTESFRRLYQVLRLMTHSCKVQKSIPISNSMQLARVIVWVRLPHKKKLWTQANYTVYPHAPRQWSYHLHRIPCAKFWKNECMSTDWTAQLPDLLLILHVYKLIELSNCLACCLSNKSIIWLNCSIAWPAAHSTSL